MTILVIGAGKSATSVAGTLEGYRHPVQRCQSAAMALPLLDHYVERYSLIMCEQGCESALLQQHLDRLERDTPVVAIGLPATTEVASVEPATSAVPSVCGVYRSQDGCQQFRCALSETGTRPASRPQREPAWEDQPVAFAYNAPMNQRR